MNEAMENCQHVWVYDHRDYETLYVKCPRCGMVRPTYPGEVAARVSRELKIRHDAPMPRCEIRDGDMEWHECFVDPKTGELVDTEVTDG